MTTDTGPHDSTAAGTDVLRARFDRDGYVIFRDLLTAQELCDLRAATDSAVADRAGPILFEQEEDVGGGGGGVPPLYKDEEGRIFRRINRVIDRGGPFAAVVRGPLLDAARVLLWPAPVWVCLNRHNMLMLKAPRNPAPVPWHQDAAVWNEGTFDHLSAIVALDDFRHDNGCLEVVPGSHRRGPLGLGWSENTARIAAECREEIERRAVEVDLKAGEAVLLHGLLLHGSGGNPSDASRRSLTVAFFPGDLSRVSVKGGEQAPQMLRLT